MNGAVIAGAAAVAAVNALPLLLGSWRWYFAQPSGTFWWLLRAGQVAVAVFVLGVGVLAAAGRYSSEQLFYLYAMLPVVVAFIAEQYRVVAAQSILDQRELESAAAVGELPESDQRELVAAILRREMGVMTLSALVVVFLALRAASTAHGF
jgi:hypothetical protein